VDSMRKVALVTGAGRGIGRAIAVRLAARGADVVVADLDLNSGTEYDEGVPAIPVVDEIESLERRALGFQGDLSRRETAKAMVAAALDKFGRIDVLVNNCGGALTPIERSLASVVPDEDIDFIFRLNLLSTIYCCQEAVPTMRKQRSGCIVNISSRAGIDPAAREGRLTAYGMAKSSVIQYTRFLAHEIGPAGIRVNCVAPGTIATARILHQAKARGIATGADIDRIPLRRFGTPGDVAGVVEFLTSDLSAFVTGQCLSVCGGSVLTPS